MDIDKVLSRLRSLAADARPGFREGMKRFGIAPDTALGIPLPKLRKLAKEIGKDHALALKLWKLDIHEAKLLATMTADPKLLTPQLMDSWADDFYSWDIVDQCCSNLFDRTPFYREKILLWIESEKEYVRRAGFVLMATSAVHDKAAPDSQFISYLPLIKRYATDERNFVKKAVNWALRQIGKRNEKLRKEALKLATRLSTMQPRPRTPDPGLRAARWIGSDAARELEDAKIIARIKKKSKNK